ncbi:MAG TPA: hypothetical protein VMJ93_10420 [Verrucomicrobiae bacterium]|nr:hypothetical protein [Verrucomicrobiae bacterium]
MPADKNKKTFNDVPSALIRRFPRGPVDWGLVIAELEAKRDLLDKAIASFRAIQASGVLFGSAEDAIPPMADSVAVSLHGGEVPVGAFLGKSIPEAAKLALQIIKRKATSREIAEALKKGGVETTSKNFFSIVHSILMRSAKSGAGIVKLDRSHWGLAEWYPRGVASGASSRSNGKKRQKPGPKPKERTQQVEAKTATASGTVPQRLWDALNKPGVELSAQEIAAKAGTKSNVAMMLLGKWIKSGEVEKTAAGKYHIVKTAA